ncbi:MAG TPA: hypothetical protein PL037_02390, partial [Elusimicrobiales bacterium]|nr:hypothetical protein [Elusimicrobiales bacterium]
MNGPYERRNRASGPWKYCLLLLPCLALSGCFGGMKKLKVVDFTEQRIADVAMTRKVVGKREFVFFSTAKTGSFFD